MFYCTKYGSITFFALLVTIFAVGDLRCEVLKSLRYIVTLGFKQKVRLLRKAALTILSAPHLLTVWTFTLPRLAKSSFASLFCSGLGNLIFRWLCGHI